MVHFISYSLVMFCKRFVLNVFSETTGLMLIIDMKHCLIDLYQICSVGDRRV